MIQNAECLVAFIFFILNVLNNGLVIIRVFLLAELRVINYLN